MTRRWARCSRPSPSSPPPIAPVAAHEPDPMLGGTLWAQDQVVCIRVEDRPGPARLGGERHRCGGGRCSADPAARGPRSSFGRRAPRAPSRTASRPAARAAGIACFDRAGAPSSFKMWFRAHGYVFDWGTLRWCQGLAAIASGCFDVENIALDEFGHVEILNHHANNGDGSDYLDAVVQTVSRAYPAAGWNAHAFGRCDVARLQLEYERTAAAAPFSTCLAVATTTTLGASPASIAIGGTVAFRATLRAANLAVNRALANDPIGARTVAPPATDPRRDAPGRRSRR